MIFNVGGGGASKASQVKYDNSTSGLGSDNVQGAVDELQESVNELNDSLGNYIAIKKIKVTLPNSANAYSDILVGKLSDYSIDYNKVIGITIGSQIISGTFIIPYLANNNIYIRFGSNHSISDTREYTFSVSYLTK